jgi:folate-binding protein YgfZ
MIKTKENSSLRQFHSGKTAAVLRVTGEDAANFLQGQFTNDLRGLRAAGAVYGLWLNQKGKVVADSFVIAGASAGEFWIVSYHAAAAVLRARLEDYIIADDVSVEDVTTEWTGLTLLGAGVVAWFAQAPRAGLSFPGRRTSGETLEWIFPLSEWPNARAQLAGWAEIDGVAMERQRIAAGLPAVPADIGPADLPGEGGLEPVTISYTKGCYLGQEVMARLKSMGQVRRRLQRVRGPGAAPQRPAALWQGGRQIGELRSAVDLAEGGFIGLAMVSLVSWQPAQPLALEVAGAPEIVVVPEAT